MCGLSGNPGKTTARRPSNALRKSDVEFLPLNGNAGIPAQISRFTPAELPAVLFRPLLKKNACLCAAAAPQQSQPEAVHRPPGAILHNSCTCSKPTCESLRKRSFSPGSPDGNQEGVDSPPSPACMPPEESPLHKPRRDSPVSCPRKKSSMTLWNADCPLGRPHKPSPSKSRLVFPGWLWKKPSRDFFQRSRRMKKPLFSTVNWHRIQRWVILSAAC